MLKTQFISQIYWPDFLMGQKEKGFLIGWNMENFQCCITNFVIVPETSFTSLQQTLNTIGTENLWSCSKTDAKPIILGEWMPALPEDYTPPLAYQREGIWLTLTSRKSGPLLHSLYSCGCLHRTSCHMIRYRALQARQLHSFSVSTSDINGAASVTSSSEGPAMSSSASHITDLSYAIFQINNAENLGAFIYEYFPSESSLQASPTSVKLSSHPVSQEEQEQDHVSTERDLLLPSSTSSSTPSGSRSAAVAPNSDGSASSSLTNWTMFMLYGSYLWLSLLSMLQALLEKPLSSIFVSLLTRLLPSSLSSRLRSPLSAPRFLRSASLKDISITSAYICERSRLLWHCLYTSINFVSKSSMSEVKSRRQQWIFISSRLIFICIDILLGVIFGLYLWHNRIALLASFHDIGAYVQTHVLLGNLEFLNNAPYGIKFNHLLTARLSSVLGQSIVALSSGYNYFIRESYEEYLIIAISFMGCFGFSFQMLLVVDIIRSLTVHISVIHMAFSVVHYFQLKSLNTLFYLFQGKKKNYLRKRIDTLETNKSQLFFGTVYFTVLCFLFPTLAVYFFLFTMLQFCVVMVQAGLWGCSIIVKEFPWCEIYLYFRDPHVLSNGVRISIDYIRSSQKWRESPSHSHIADGAKDKRRHTKKDLLRQTLERENKRMLTESARRRENSSMSELAGGETKVKFAETIQTFPYCNSADSEEVEVTDRNKRDSSHRPLGDITQDKRITTTSGDDPEKINLLNINQKLHHAGSPIKKEQGNDKDDDAEDDENEDENEGDDKERDGDDNLSVGSHSSDSSNSSNSSGSSEEIGWARCHSEEDGDMMGEDSIFAMENIWGSSDDMDNDHAIEKEKNQKSTTDLGADLSSLSIDVPDFYCAPSDHPDAPLSPLVNRYSPTSKRMTGSFCPISSCTTYLSIQPATQPFLYHLFKPYFPYFAYWSKKESILRLVRGLIKGNPALDLQIIRAAVEISSSSLRGDRAASLEQAPIHVSPRSGRGRGRGRKTTLSTATSAPPPLPSSALPSLARRATSHGSHDSGEGEYHEVNAVSRSPNVFDLWSLLLHTSNNVFSTERNEGIHQSDSKQIFIYGVESKRFSKTRKLEKLLFCFLIFTLSLCILVALLGLCYACSPAISSLISKFFRFIIKAIKRSRVSNVPQKGIFDIAKVHSFFSHHHRST